MKRQKNPSESKYIEILHSAVQSAVFVNDNAGSKMTHFHASLQHVINCYSHIQRSREMKESIFHLLSPFFYLSVKVVRSLPFRALLSPAELCFPITSSMCRMMKSLLPPGSLPGQKLTVQLQ